MGYMEEIRNIRMRVLLEQNDLHEADFEQPIMTEKFTRWDSIRRVLLQFGNHMREHATHIEGTRAALDRPPTQAQRILAEAEIAWGNLLAAMVGLNDEDLDEVPPGGGWTVRQILEHVRNSEAAYLEAIEKTRHGNEMNERD